MTLRIVSLASVLLIGCVGFDSEPQRFVLEGDDVVVGPGQLAFPAATHSDFDRANTNDLVAGIQGGGYLRRVVDINRVGGSYQLATEDVTLGEAVGNAESPNRIAEGGKADGGSQDFHLGFSGYDIVMAAGSGLDVELDRAILSFKPTLDLDLVVNDWNLEHFLIRAAGQLQGQITVEVDATGAGIWKLAKQMWTTSELFVQWVGWVPVVEQVELVAGVGVDIEAEGPVHTYLDAVFTAEANAGVEYVNHGWQNLGGASLDGSTHVGAGAAATGLLTITPYLFAEARVWMYGAAGPYVKVSPNLRFRREVDGSWTKTIGIKANGGANLANPFGNDLRYDAELFNLMRPI